MQTTDNVYLQRYGRPDLLLLVAAAYDAEINRMMRIPEARDAATEAFGRGLWDAINNYGEDGVYFYLGALQSVRMRVDAEDVGQELYDFDEALSQARLIVEPNNPDWCNGYQPNRPAWWGNVSEEILSDNSPLPTFKDAFLEKRVGEQQDQIWYISPDGIFFIVSQVQQRYLCGNQSCVSPMYFYRAEP